MRRKENRPRPTGNGESGKDDSSGNHILARVSALLDAAAILSDDCATAFARTCRMRDAVATRHLYRAAQHALLAAEALAESEVA